MMCRLSLSDAVGNRSEEAGKVLVEAGIRNVYNIDEGFEGKQDDHHRSSIGGWRYHELLWEHC
jgi:rhodanese-related sulfurtransferase